MMKPERVELELDEFVYQVEIPERLITQGMIRRTMDSWLEAAIGEMDEDWTDYWGEGDVRVGHFFIVAFCDPKHQRQFHLWCRLQGLDPVMSRY